MYVHLSSPFLQAVSLHLFYLGRVPFFLVLAGYFLGRNITWNKAFNRAFWLFIPFMFWNVLYVFLGALKNSGAVLLHIWAVRHEKQAEICRRKWTAAFLR